MVLRSIKTIACVICLAAGLSRCEGRGSGGVATQPPLTADLVIGAEQHLWTLFQQKDTLGMMAVLDSNFTAFSSSMKNVLDGPEAEKRHFMAFFEDFGGSLLRWKLLSPKVQLFSEIGLLTYRFSVTVAVGKDTVTYEGKQTSVWRYKDGQYYQVHYHYCYDNADSH